jgi:hypothetical protein
MSAQGTPSIPAGWYPDPQNPAQGRFWDGAAWTDLYHQPGTPFPAAPELKAPAGTDWNTPWIWLIVVLPVLPSLLLLFVPWGSMFDIDVTATNPYVGMSNSFALFLSPFYWGAIVLSYVGYGLCVFFAFRDAKELAARGVPKPFHWAFAFISGIVYTIGRSVVVHRRTGNGHQPIWAEVAVFVVSIGIVIAIMVMMFAGMNEFLQTNIPR